jgi:uncharacterized protein with von Willebrand factor type A (vWA) domain
METLQREYDRFIEFGQLLNKQMRRYLVAYLKNQLNPQEEPLPRDINDQYFQYFKKALDQLLHDTGLLDLLTGKDRLTRQVVTELLRWLRKAHQKATTRNPFQEEKQRLESWSITPLHVLERRWPHLVNYLDQEYRKDELDTGFFRQEMQTLLSSGSLKELAPEKLERLELLFTDLLAQWDALLHARILDYELRHMEEEKQAYQDYLSAKVDEYRRLESLLAPFSDYLGWDLSQKLWQETSFDVLEQYDALLELEESIRELADLLGKMREAEIEMQQETLEKTIIRQEWVADPFIRSQVVGVHESDDLNNLLSSEAGLLGAPQTEALFLKKFVDKSLLSLRYEDKRLETSTDKTTEVYNKVREKEKGPFIICVDTSESMMGRPEEVAKVCTLAILKMALQENRPAYLINFSQGIETLDLQDVAGSLDALAGFLKMSFYGGTDISLALHESFRQLRQENYREADILVISDFIMYRIDPRILDEVHHFQHNQGTQFHSLTLGDQANAKIVEAFDTNWQYNPREKGIVRNLLKTVEHLRH